MLRKLGKLGCQVRFLPAKHRSLVMNELLQRVGWSKAFFARHWGVSEDTVGAWCREKPNVGAMRYLEMVARFLGV